MEREFAALLEECRRGGIEVRVDSRQVSTGDIFVAVPGVNEDGGRFIPAAVAAGASIVVCRPWRSGRSRSACWRLPRGAPF